MCVCLFVFLLLFFFFFKQKTAYEMRISDWSSDVCSSDLDEEADSFFVLAVGRLKVSQLTSEGQEVIIRYIGPKEMFGCVAVCGGLTYPGTATAVVDSW